MSVKKTLSEYLSASTVPSGAKKALYGKNRFNCLRNVRSRFSEIEHLDADACISMTFKIWHFFKRRFETAQEDWSAESDRLWHYWSITFWEALHSGTIMLDDLTMNSPFPSWKRLPNIFNSQGVLLLFRSKQLQFPNKKICWFSELVWLVGLLLLHGDRQVIPMCSRLHLVYSFVFCRSWIWERRWYVACTPISCISLQNWRYVSSPHPLLCSSPVPPQSSSPTPL